jgi:hypothetical protein
MIQFQLSQCLNPLENDNLRRELKPAEGHVAYRNVLGGIIRDYYREAT